MRLSVGTLRQVVKRDLPIGVCPVFEPHSAEVRLSPSALSVGHAPRDPQRDVQHYYLLACASAEDTSWTKSPRYRAAILAADIAGYSRLMHEDLMHEDEPATVRDLKSHQSVMLPLIGRHGGRIIDTAGDGIMAEFPSVIGATECADEIQAVIAERNQRVPESRRMRFRIGINLGDVIHDETQIYGDGINIAARLEALAEPGGVLVSNTVYDQVRGKLPLTFEDVGERQVKNIEQPVRMYQLHIPGAPSKAVAAYSPFLPTTAQRYTSSVSTRVISGLVPAATSSISSSEKN